jgi:hypothetical protein
MGRVRHRGGGVVVPLTSHSGRASTKLSTHLRIPGGKRHAEVGRTAPYGRDQPWRVQGHHPHGDRLLHCSKSSQRDAQVQAGDRLLTGERLPSGASLCILMALSACRRASSNSPSQIIGRSRIGRHRVSGHRPGRDSVRTSGRKAGQAVPQPVSLMKAVLEAVAASRPRVPLGSLRVQAYGEGVSSREPMHIRRDGAIRPPRVKGDHSHGVGRPAAQLIVPGLAGVLEAVDGVGFGGQRVAEVVRGPRQALRQPPARTDSFRLSMRVHGPARSRSIRRR